MSEPGVQGRDDDPLRDPMRIAAARRLLQEVAGHAAFDRLSGLAARLVGAGHAKVTIFTDEDRVVGGYGLPEGVIGGPALLTGALSAITVRQVAPLNIPAAADDPRVAGLPAVTSGQVRAYLGAPLVSASGHAVGALAVYDPVPRTWTDDDTQLLDQLAASVVAELELSAARSAVGTSLARLEVALEASSIGIWEVDLHRGVFECDVRCAAIFGVEGPVLGMPMERLLLDHVHPEDRAMAESSIADAVAARSQYTIEVRNVRADGQVRWVVSRGRVVVGADGEPTRILGTALDVTDARQLAADRIAAVQRAAAIAEVAADLGKATRMSELADVTLRGAQVLGATSSGLAVLESRSGPLRVHMSQGLQDAIHALAPEMEFPPEGIPADLDDDLPTQYAARVGERVLLADPDEAVARFPRMQEVNEALGTQALAALPLRVEGRVLGAFVLVWTTPHPFVDADLEVLDALTAQIALSVSRLQADAERDAAVAAMAEANRRLGLLADAGRVLSGTLDIAAQIEQLADLVVPELGDWCWIVVNDEQGRLYGLASAHRDPARIGELQDYVRQMVAVMTDQSAARLVTATGRPLVLPEIPDDVMARALPDEAVREGLVRLGAAAGMVVPLEARGQVLGALGLFSGEERGAHTQAEVDTAVEIGRRAGLALQQSRLYGQQRALADALQRSMLTEPPKSDDCEIVVRYVPASAGVEIGGDWYDAFLQPTGGIVLAIGDVVGHDTRAAAAMGQVRGLLRGIGYASDRTPAEVLSELDHAVDGLQLDTMATALVAQLDRDAAGCPRLRWASAGHPRPALLAPDGSVRLLDGEPADLLIGVAPDLPRSDRELVLAPGSTVLLYTDGLVERRDRDIDDGTVELVEALRDCAGRSLDDLCDGVLERLFLPDAEDDVAVLAVRLNAG
jgi:PAS domain S-box-containing protein